ncbi:MAG: hypothetical protein E4G96_10525 [Chrysiogenales bacterium]|nr:MAG: hypothetical protein E4G96_10525 [Chrysiogenales bacterium]
MSGTGRDPCPDENVKKTIDELAVRTSEYGNVLADAGEGDSASSRKHALLKGLRDLLSKQTLRTM